MPIYVGSYSAFGENGGRGPGMGCGCASLVLLMMIVMVVGMFAFGYWACSDVLGPSYFEYHNRDLADMR